MNTRHLWWIIPLCLIVFGSIGYIKGVLDGANLVVDRCNAQYELGNALNKLENVMCDTAINMWEYYEIRCPNVYDEIISESINLQDEFKKYGINNSN